MAKQLNTILRKMRADAHELLALLARLPRLPDDPLTVEVADPDLKMGVRIVAETGYTAPAEKVPGRHLSDLESLIWQTLEEPLTMAKLAERLGRKNDQHLQVTVKNLVGRAVLTWDEETGYARATQETP